MARPNVDSTYLTNEGLQVAAVRYVGVADQTRAALTEILAAVDQAAAQIAAIDQYTSTRV